MHYVKELKELINKETGYIVTDIMEVRATDKEVEIVYRTPDCEIPKIFVVK